MINTVLPIIHILLAISIVGLVLIQHGKGADAGAAFGGKYMIMTNRRGPHTNITGLPNQLPFFKAADYQSYISRVSAMPEFMDKSTDRIRAGRY